MRQGRALGIRARMGEDTRHRDVQNFARDFRETHSKSEVRRRLGDQGVAKPKGPEINQ